LPTNQFVKCNKQQIVNMTQVDSFNNNSIEIKGQQISISRTEQLEVLKNKNVDYIYKSAFCPKFLLLLEQRTFL